MGVRQFLLILIAAAAIAGAGCGGDGDGSDGGSDAAQAQTGQATADAESGDSAADDAEAGVAAGNTTGGGPEAGDASSGGAPSKSEYIAQADEICRKAEDAFTQEIDDSFEGQSPSEDEFAAALRTGAVENLEGQLNDLRALTPPAGDEDTLAAIYDTLEVAVDGFVEDPSSLMGRPSRAMKDASRRAAQYGLTVCGN